MKCVPKVYCDIIFDYGKVAIVPLVLEIRKILLRVIRLFD